MRHKNRVARRGWTFTSAGLKNPGMCAEYNLKTTDRDLSGLLKVDLLNMSELSGWENHTRLYSKAPVIYKKDGQVLLDEMHFSMLPPGGRIPFTANTRLDDWDERKNRVSYVYERPTWKEAFLKRRCVVPMSEFLEPIYMGDYAGQMMAFYDGEFPLLLAAGIYQEGVNVKTGEVYMGFSLLTDYAHPFVREAGHSRTVIILPAPKALEWIDEKPITGEQGVKFLIKNKQNLDLSIRSERTMKNWKARAAAKVEDFHLEEKTRLLVEPTREN
jgi:putative SOS response-associated peptidase YedK